MTTRVHVDYPHNPGRLYDCDACEARCHCTPNTTVCVFEGPHRYVTPSDVIVAECPDHGMPRRVGRPDDTLTDDDGVRLPDGVFRCDGCTREDQTLDPRDIDLDAHESWHVAADGRLVVIVWDPSTDDDDTDDERSVVPAVTVSADLVVTVHVPDVDVDPDGRGMDYRPSCSCGWTYGRRYAADHAARGIAQAHADGTLS